MERKWTLTIAASERAGDGGWDTEREFDLDELFSLLTKHKPGPKAGTCFIPGKLSRPRRLKDNVATLEVMVLDVDAGHPFNEVVISCELAGLSCAIATSHSHMKTHAKVKRQAYRDSGLGPEQFLEQRVGLLPEIAKGATEAGVEGKDIILQHLPCPRIRVIFPLAKPWRREDYSSLKEAELDWARMVVRAAHHLQITGVDKCSERLTQLYFMPRYPVGGTQPQSEILDGKLLDPWSLPDPPHSPEELREKALAQDEESPPERKGQKSKSTSKGIIDEFNRLFSTEEILAEHFYQKVGPDRFLFPGSSGGSPGVALLEDGSKVYSHHANDPLADGYAHKAFDCLRILGHEGDLKSALLEARERIPDKLVEDLNKSHAFTTIGSKAVVLYEKELPGDDGCHLDFLSPNAFREKYCNRMVPVGEKEKAKMIPLGKYWMNSPLRREVKGVYFDPARTRPDWFNMWTGFWIEPTPKPEPEKWGHYRQHLEEIICSGNQELIHYVLAWMADLVQNPGRKIGVALALRGGRGIGKGCYVKPLQKFLGRHSIQINNRSQFTGRFNGHLADKLLVFVDEGYWSGDRQGEGVLKGLITEEELTVERKGVDAIRMRNYSRFIIASNDHWVVPAGPDERRFLVLDVNNKRAQDHDYFAPIFHEMEHGGDAALLRFLLDFDLTGINLRKVPRTQALIEQKLNSLNSIQSFWYEILISGSFIDEFTTDLKEDSWEKVQIFIQNETLKSRYEHFCNRRKSFIQPSDMLLKGLFSSGGLCPGAKKSRPNISGNRTRGYSVPPLDQCRLAFEQALDADGEFEW